MYSCTRRPITSSSDGDLPHSETEQKQCENYNSGPSQSTFEMWNNHLLFFFLLQSYDHHTFYSTQELVKLSAKIWIDDGEFVKILHDMIYSYEFKLSR